MKWLQIMMMTHKDDDDDHDDHDGDANSKDV